MTTTNKTKVRTVYYVADAGYRAGYSGSDHLLPDHHTGMIGRIYESREDAQAELERRTKEPVPAFTEIWVVEITDEMARSAWLSLAAESDRVRTRQDGDACRRLASKATRQSVQFDGDDLMRVVEPISKHSCYGPRVAIVGRVQDHRTKTFTLRA